MSYVWRDALGIRTRLSLRAAKLPPKLLLAAASAFDYLLQLGLPAILVRMLSADEFGQYRVLWLVALTSVALFPLYLPNSLFFYVPRTGKRERARLAANAIVWSMVAGILAATILSAATPALPESVQVLRAISPAVAIFIALWVGASLLDTLLLADSRVGQHALIVLFLAVTRFAAVAAAAFFAREITAVVIALAAFASLKLIFLLAVLRRNFRLGTQWPEWGAASQQLIYCLPLAGGSFLFAMRGQVDQWIVASTLDLSAFAIVSVAAVVPGAIAFVRTPLVQAELSSISTFLAGGNTAEALRTIKAGYRQFSLILPPVIGAVFVVAPELVEIVYTDRYLQASSVMRIYLVGQLALVLAAGHLLPLVGRGKEAALVSLVTLPVSGIVAYLAISRFGVAGAALGGSSALLLGELIALGLVARALRVRALSLFDHRYALVSISIVALSALVIEVISALCMGETPTASRLVIKFFGYATVVAALAHTLAPHAISEVRSLIFVPIATRKGGTR